MSSRIIVQDYKDGKLIDLSSPLSSKRRILYYFFALNFFGVIVRFGFTLAEIDMWEHLIATFFDFLVVAIALMAIFRCLNKATEKEKLFITKNRLDVLQSNLTRNNTASFEIDHITDLQFGERLDIGDHPLKGNSIDYLGFQAGQQIVSNLNSEGRICFLYNGREYRIGKDLASWEFDEICEVIYSQTGKDLTVRKQSEDLFPKLDN